jgi:hypothetical protein
MAQGARTCTAHTSAGAPCRKPPIKGALICSSHGAGAPQVREAARRRLLEAVDPLIARLVLIAKTTPDHAVAVRAITAALDRAGYGPISTQVQVDGGQVAYRIEGVDLEAL